MTKEEYKAESKLIADEASSKQKSLNRLFAFENATHKVGDIATDHMGSIRVSEIKYSTFGDYPEAVYKGIELTKKNEPKKSGSERLVFQGNIKSTK